MQHVRAPEKPLETHVRVARATPEQRPAPARVDGDPPSRRPAARRLPDAVPRLRASISPTCASTSISDDVRHIDWNVTARLQTPYVREYNEDREVTAWFLLDSAPLGRLRLARGEEARGVDRVRHACSRARSRATATASARIFYGDGVDTVIPARSGRRHVLHILHRMLQPSGAPGVRRRPTSTSCSHAALRRHARGARSCSSFPISSAAPGWAEPLARLAQRHEVVAVRLYDPLEMELPDLGLLVIQDAETGEQLFVDTHDRGFRKRFAARGGEREEELRTAFRRAGVDALELATDDDLVDAILRFADLRKRRSQLAGGRRRCPRHLGITAGP